MTTQTRRGLVRTVWTVQVDAELSERLRRVLRATPAITTSDVIREGVGMWLDQADKIVIEAEETAAAKTTNEEEAE